MEIIEKTTNRITGEPELVIGFSEHDLLEGSDFNYMYFTLSLGDLDNLQAMLDELLAGRP